MIKFKLHELMARDKIFKVSRLVELTKKYHKGGINRITLSKIRNGENLHRIDLFILDVLCNVFNCSLSDLIEHVSDKGKSPHKLRPKSKKS